MATAELSRRCPPELNRQRLDRLPNGGQAAIAAVTRAPAGAPTLRRAPGGAGTLVFLPYSRRCSGSAAASRNAFRLSGAEPGRRGPGRLLFSECRAGPPGWLSGRQNRPDDERDEESEQQDLDATVLGRRRHGGYLPRIRREHRGIGDREGGEKVLGAANTSGHLALKRADCGVTHRAAANPAALRHTNVRRCAKARPAR